MFIIDNKGIYYYGKNSEFIKSLKSLCCIDVPVEKYIKFKVKCFDSSIKMHILQQHRMP